MPFDGTIMALDISSRAMGVCEGRPGEKPRFETVRLKRPDDTAEDACAAAIGWAANRFLNFPPDRLVVERRVSTFMPMKEDEEGKLRPTSNPATMELLVGLQLSIRGCAKRVGIRNVPGHGTDGYAVSVSTARKAFLGKGNLKSGDAKRAAMHVCRLLGWEPQNEDEADAACVWVWACQQLAPEKAPGTHPLQLQALQARLGRGRQRDAYEVEL